jgi:hypothetical protein
MRAAPYFYANGATYFMQFLVDIFFAIAWWVLLFPIAWIISLPTILLDSAVLRRAFLDNH